MEKEEIKKKLEKKPPVFVDKLELGDGEVYVGNLKTNDRWQLLNRRINILESGISYLTNVNTQLLIVLKEIAKQNGVKDIDKIINSAFGENK